MTFKIFFVTDIFLVWVLPIFLADIRNVLFIFAETQNKKKLN